MINPLIIFLSIMVYMGLLLVGAVYVERQYSRGRDVLNHSIIYTLGLTVYFTSWTFYGGVGKAAQSGMMFFVFYLGVIAVIFFWRLILQKILRIKQNYKMTSIADFLSSRYDKSYLVALLVTIFALFGVMPYIALQIKAINTSYQIISVPNNLENWSFINEYIGLIVAFVMTIFTIVFGVRRSIPTKRHPGMVFAVAVGGVVKLGIFLIGGIFVVYFLFNGLEDMFNQVRSSPLASSLDFERNNTNDLLEWIAQIFLAMLAVMFLPRQFHMSVLENSNEKHINDLLWQFPLYTLLITFFAFPIAVAGLLEGMDLNNADSFILLLSMQSESNFLPLLIFIGGFSASICMIMICALTLSTMITNHIFIPLFGLIKPLHFLQRHILELRWFSVAICIFLGYWFEKKIGHSYMLVNMGVISFMAVAQFTPAFIGGLYWKKGNKIGAVLGMTAGFAIWFYTMIIPSFAKSGWISQDILIDGPAGIAFLRPEHLFGIAYFSPIPNSLIWSLFFNVFFYIFGSLYSKTSLSGNEAAQSFVMPYAGRIEANYETQYQDQQASIQFEPKISIVEGLLSQYFSKKETSEMLSDIISEINPNNSEVIPILDLLELNRIVENTLASSIGASASHHAVKKANIITPEESKQLTEIFRKILMDLKVSPLELKDRVNYYQERAKILTDHSFQLENTVKELESQIHKREKAEKSLLESENKFSVLVETMNDGLLIINEQLQLTYVNQRFTEMLGYSKTEILQHTLYDFFDDENKSKLQGELEKRKEGLYEPYEIAWTNKYNQTIYTIISPKPIFDEKNNFKGSFSVVTDITSLKQAEIQILESLKKAETADQMKSAFLANMSHEIRTPLTAILGYVDIMLRNPDYTENFKTYLGIIKSNSNHLLSLINDILELSRIEANRTKIELKSCHLDNIFNNVFYNAKVLISKYKKNIILKQDIDSRIKYDIITDSTRLMQILNNLVGNAVKFTKEGIITFGVRLKEDYFIEFYVEDTGIGIPVEKFEEIFNPFSQVDISDTRKYGGTGLGLTITKKLVEILGGSIKVKSLPGKGSLFYFSIPYKPVTEEETIIQSEAIPNNKKNMTILIVEDNIDNQELIKVIMQQAGFSFLTANDGEEALNLYKSDPSIGMILMDIQMPNLDGIEATKMIRDYEEKQSKEKIPIIALTAAARKEDKDRCMEAGCDDYLTKPLDIDKLLHTIHKF